MLNEKFWLAVSFFAFVVLIVKYVWPHIAKALDSNSKKIAEELIAAKELKERAEKLLINAEKFYNESVAFAQKLTQDAEAETKKLTEESRQALELEIKKRTETALSRVKLEEERMIREVKIQIINSTMEKLAGNLDLNQGEQEKLIEKSIKNLEHIQ